MRLRLTDQDRARVARPPDGLGIGGRDVAVEHRRAVGRADALGVEEILDTEGEAGQRAGGPAAGVERFRCSGLLRGSLEADRRERPQLRVQLVDAGAQRRQDLDG